VYKEVKMVAGTQQTIEATIWNAAVDMAHRYVSAYRETLLTDSQIVAAMTADARSSVFSHGRRERQDWPSKNRGRTENPEESWEK
jgi:hypothetical protein